MIVWCAAGPDLGVGHLSRCATLCRALVDAGQAPLLLVEAAQAYPAFAARAGCEVDWIEGREAAWSVLGSRGGGLLVTDLLGLSAADSRRARALGFGPLAHINDSLNDYAADLLVDTDVTPSAVAPTGVEVLAGAAWHMVRPDVTAARPAIPWSGAKAQTVLLTFGGADPARATEALVAGLAGGPLKVTAALGPAMPQARKDALRQKGGAAFVDAPEAMSELILAHDLIVTLGGLTSYEAMVLGRPTACVSWRNMAPYVAQLAQAGAAGDLGPVETAAKAVLALVEDGARLSALARKGFEAVDGEGARRVAEILCARAT
jgi:UDP-2,4-diacetamido-2,4,6-trideoxy-beta-L-altropyranose hydrolase